MEGQQHGKCQGEKIALVIPMGYIRVWSGENWAKAALDVIRSEKTLGYSAGAIEIR